VCGTHVVHQYGRGTLLRVCVGHVRPVGGLYRDRSYSVDFIWGFPITIGKPIHFGDSWLDPPVLLPSLYHNPSLDLFQIFYTLPTSLNVRISRGLEQLHSLVLAKSAQVTRIRKDDWSRADVPAHA
jgi:hypothetical protein